MFTNVSGPSVFDVAGVSAVAQALVYHEDEEARRSDRWRDNLAERLRADLTTLDSLAHGFAAAAPSEKRSPTRIGPGRAVIAALALVLGIAIIAVVGLRGAFA